MSNKKSRRQTSDAAALRARAEELLRAKPSEMPSVPTGDVQALIHELSVYQAELEIQNEELRDAQVDLAYSRDRFSDLYDFAPVGYATLNKEGRILELNLTAANLLGDHRQNLVGANISTWLEPDSHDICYLHRQAVLSSDTKQTCEVTLRQPDGTLLTVRLESIAFGPEGERHCRTALIDVTDITTIRQTLEESEHRYRRLTAAVTDYVFRVLVVHGRVVETLHGVNCKAVTGYTPEDFHENPLLWIAMVPPEDRPLVEEQAARLLAGQEPPPIEHRIHKKDGQICWVLNTASPQYDAQGELIAYDGLLREITRRKKVEEALNDLNETLEERVAEQTQEVRLLAEAMASLEEGVMITTDHMIWPGPEIVYVNDALCRITGYSKEELIGQTPRLFQGEASNRETIELLRKSLLAQQPYQCELINYRKDGTQYPAELFISPLVDTQGNTTHYIGIHRDISARKQTEIALHHDHELNRNIIDTTQNIILLLDSDGCIVNFNQYAEKLTGWKFEEVQGRNWFETFQPDQDQELVRQLFQRALAGEQTVGNVNTILTKGGRPLEVEWFDARLFAEDGEFVGLLCTGRDITERLFAESALRESNERLRSILQTAADAIITIDQRGVIDSINSATTDLFGYTQDELIGENVKMLMPPPYCDRHDGYLSRYLKTGEARMIGVGREVSGLRKDGSIFPASLAVSEVINSGLFTGIIRDLSDRRFLQQQILQIATDEQRRIGQDLHDGVGQELTGLGLMADTLISLLARCELNIEGSQTLSVSNKLSTGLKRVLGQVRAISKGLVPVQIHPDGLSSGLNNLAKHVTDLYDISCRASIPVPVAVHDSETATHLYRIAQEASTNCIKHGRATQVTISLSQAGSQIVLEVEDNGIGIENVPLARDHSSGSDSEGIGMRIMHYRAWLIGGHLTVQAGEQGGTRLCCTVDATDPGHV